MHAGSFLAHGRATYSHICAHTYSHTPARAHVCAHMHARARTHSQGDNTFVTAMGWIFLFPLTVTALECACGVHSYRFNPESLLGRWKLCGSLRMFAYMTLRRVFALWPLVLMLYIFDKV